MNLQHKKYELALLKVPGVGHVLSKQLISYCGTAEAVFKLSKGKLLRIPNIGEKIASEIQQFRAWESIEKELELLERQQILLLSYTDKEYPLRLKQIHDAPILLYYKGNVSLNSAKTVCIVGTRNATEYGKQIVKHIITHLSKIPSLLIVSGLAYGIDVAAHRACLELGIPTIGVLGSGLDIIYPSAHRRIAEEMLLKGGLVSELPLGTAPEASHFPARNRIIAGMSDAVIVVEAARQGGALITANLAFDYSREVFACPGSLFSAYSEGCHELIASQKAHIWVSLKKFLEIMNWHVEAESAQQSHRIDFSSFTEEERNILMHLQAQELHIDELSYRTQIAVNRLASLLLSLELNGWIKTLPGKKIAFNSHQKP